MAADITTAFTVNGSKIIKKVNSEKTLLDFLRSDLKLTGVKKGCNNGDCGSCTPGMIMTGTGLLMENPNPSRTEIREFIGPRNICRCTGYQKIVDAVEDAGRVLRGEKSLLTDLPDDASLRRKDTKLKVTGKVKYADDIEIEGMIYGKIKFSDIPSGTLRKLIPGDTEVESGYAVPDGRGGVGIYYPTQAIFDDQRQVSGALGIYENKVRVIQLPTGGAFGGKEDVLFQHILAAAAIKFNKTVQITLSREDSLRVVQKKHGIDFKASPGVDKTGQFKVLDVDIVTDTGAYASLGHDIIENAMSFAGGPYYIPELRINGEAVYTNNVMGGAMRGFGANQANFMIESLINMAALKLTGDSVTDNSTGKKVALSELGAPFRTEFRAFPPKTETFPEESSQKDFTSPNFKSRRTHWAYAYGVQIALVEVDETTGKVLVKKIITVSDLGKVLNKRAVEGQQEGGVVMGVGYALTEKYVEEKGQNVTKTYGELGLTTADEAPEIINRVVEVPHPWGPLGAKGLAEAPSLSTAPTITNAIFDATGVRIFDLPVNRKLLIK